ncbi:hypothetical protein EYR40_006530 [Pleurotus pulmonarius]|nr:hypothetical protein EYR36_011150 [Pleurotus pulmonarius]KAF4599436.1 hypothetical protein EYR40_006530 [Pleurotus pulmonarius]
MENDNIHSVTHSPPARGRLLEHELFWRDHYDWLLSNGFQLRDRYKPNWKPSWEGTKKPSILCTDGLLQPHPSVLDAERQSNGELLVLKRVRKSLHPHEAEIGQYFSTSSVASDKHNHCIPIYDVLQVPDNDDLVILVMPFLRPHDDPAFDTIGEAVEFFSQVFEGLQFMHQHHVAHRDVAYLNVLMDANPLFVDRYHPSRLDYKLDMSGPAKHYTRTQKPVKYYLTDFGLSRKYNAENLPVSEDVIFGADKTVPEFKSMKACNPFPTDVYTLGNMIREQFIEGSSLASRKFGFEFMKPLVADMTQVDPSKRPTMDAVVQRFDKLRSGLGTWKLRSRVVDEKESYLKRVVRGVDHWKRRIWWTLRRVPPLPSPRT